MITYKRGCRHFVCSPFQLRGSVFPSAVSVALPCALATAALKYCIDEGYFPGLAEDGSRSILKDNSAWSGFVFLVGFLTVFRTSQAYSRFWDGCTSVHVMRAEWCDACAALMAFCKYTNENQDGLIYFQQVLIRLFSMLHAVALADIEDNNQDPTHIEALKYELLDPAGLDPDSLKVVKACDDKVELVFQWIQQLIVENVDAGILKIPPPILSRAFQEIGNGMVAFREAMKIASIPFPFPYAQVCEWLLVLHWLTTPLVVSQYVSSPLWAGVFSFLQVSVYWCMNAIAVEIENPFGMDANDLDASRLQEEVNRHLLLLMDPQTKRTPTMVSSTKTYRRLSTQSSLEEVWASLDIPSEEEEGEGGERASTPTSGVGSRNFSAWAHNVAKAVRPSRRGASPAGRGSGPASSPSGSKDISKHSLQGNSSGSNVNVTKSGIPDDVRGYSVDSQTEFIQPHQTSTTPGSLISIERGHTTTSANSLLAHHASEVSLPQDAAGGIPTLESSPVQPSGDSGHFWRGGADPKACVPAEPSSQGGHGIGAGSVPIHTLGNESLSRL